MHTTKHEQTLNISCVWFHYSIVWVTSICILYIQQVNIIPSSSPAVVVVVDIILFFRTLSSSVLLGMNGVYLCVSSLQPTGSTIVSLSLFSVQTFGHTKCARLVGRYAGVRVLNCMLYVCAVCGVVVSVSPLFLLFV